MLDFLSCVLVALLQAVVVAFCGAVVRYSELAAVLPSGCLVAELIAPICIVAYQQPLVIVELLFGAISVFDFPPGRVRFAIQSVLFYRKVDMLLVAAQVLHEPRQ